MRRLAAIASIFALTAMAPAAGPLAKVQGDGFSVMMPGTPQKISNKVEISAGTVATQAWTVNEGGAIYSVSTADYPDAVARARPAAAFLSEARNGLLNQLKGTLSSESAIAIDGNAGLAYIVSSPNGEVKARNLMAGRRLYTLLVLYNPSIGAPQADGFLTSLRLEK